MNYNRDIEIFPVLNAMFKKIYNESPYKSPTDMGVNMAGFCIVDDDAVRQASHNEIIRRYFKTLCQKKKGMCNENAVQKVETLMRQAQITEEDRPVVRAAIERSEATDNQPAVAIELPNGKIVTGKTSALLGAASAALLNAVKTYSGLEKPVKLIDPAIIEPVQALKVKTLGNHNPRLHSDETLIALSISATMNDNAKLAYENLECLKGCEAHSTVMLAQVDEDIYRKLGINLTCEPTYTTKKLFHK